MRTAIASCILAAVLAFAPAIPACADLAENRISVTGDAEIFVAADFAIITLGVTTQAASVTEASSQNAAHMSRVVAAVRGLVAETDIETLNFSVGPRHPPRRTDQDYYSDTLRPIIGYTVSNSVSIVVRDMNKVSEVIDRSIQAGANVVGGISFGVKDIAAQIDRARTAAIENARHKATVYAAAAGLDLGRALSVSDVPSFGITRIEDVVNQLPQSYAAQDAGPATPVLPSKVRILAAVTVMFAVK